jgi:4-nitrophenyl phosphatase
MLAERLQSLGIAVEPAAVLTAAQATTAYLLSELPSGAGLFVIGEAPLRNALQDAGFELLPTAQGAQAVVVGLDRRADWDKLTEAALAIQDGAVFIGTNPDRSLPVERGLAIGNGALLAAIQAATDVAPAIVGKPEPHLFRLALRRLGTEPSHTVALGDRLETDILGGQRAGLRTALVLTGASSRELLQGSAVKPDWVFDDLHAFSLALKQAR